MIFKIMVDFAQCEYKNLRKGKERSRSIIRTNKSKTKSKYFIINQYSKDINKLTP